MSQDLKSRMEPRAASATPVKKTFHKAAAAQGEVPKKTSILLAPSLHTRARVAAATQGLSVGKLMSQALDEYLDKNGF